MMSRILFLFLIFFLSPHVAQADKMETIRAEIAPTISQELQQDGFQLGNPVFIRVFKQERVVEVWIKKSGKRKYDIFKKYPICVFSGKLGPKLRDGDLQSPEGFYDVTAERLHPKSRFHLAFNLGYPNEFDLQRQRTGNFLMIHGGCESQGCYAMTDEGMEELYVLTEAALANGQNKVDVHIFPFYMTKKNFRFHAKSSWLAFWYSLKPAYDMFQTKRIPPQIEVVNGRYKIKDTRRYND